MAFSASSRWLALAGGAALMAGIALASLVPVDWQIRTGLHWTIEHFLVYFAATAIFCLAWPRPLIVAGSLIAFSALFEALQALTPDRVPDLPTALSGAAGAIAAALLIQPFLRARKGGGSAGEPFWRGRRLLARLRQM